MYVKRLLEPIIETSLRTGYVTTILGPRRVGKTSLVKHLLAQMPNIKSCHLNLDQLQTRERIRNLELADLITESCQQHIGGPHKLWISIDEAQKSPELFEQIKIIYDDWKDSNKVKFILTGSAHLSLHQLSSETLAGRIESYYLQPFTLSELTSINAKGIPTNSLLELINSTESQDLPNVLQNAITQTTPYKLQLQENLQQMLVWGGLPEVENSSDVPAKQRYLYNYIDTYLEQDIRKITTITDLHLYKNLMNIVAQQTGSLRDDTKILEALGCGRDTLKKYRGYLQSTLMYSEIFPYIAATTKKLVKSPKAYMLDNGIISNLTGIYDLEILNKTGLIGHRFENWFLQELRAWLSRLSIRSDICFWRLSTGAEVDFIISTKPEVYPFEITYGTRPERKKNNNLIRFLEEQPSIPWAFYIYNGPFNVDHEYKIIYIPAWCI